MAVDGLKELSFSGFMERGNRDLHVSISLFFVYV